MDIINSSQDIFYLVLAFCVLWFTVLITWLMYYAINAVRNIYDAIQSVKRKIDAIDDVITLVKTKITSSFSYFGLAMSGLKKMSEFLGDKADDSEKPARKAKR